MKNISTYLLAILAFAFVLSSSCDEEDKLVEERETANPVPGAPSGSSGNLNVSKYISLGNSLTAGFQDGALYTSGQDNSYPNLLAQQLQISGIGGGAFNQPDINSANGFSGNGPNGPLGRLELSLSLLRPVPTVGELPTAYTGDKSALNNFGVPGMKLTDVNNPGLAANGLYARFATNPGTSTVQGEAQAANATFFTYWLGSNDALSYAVGGGTDESLITDAGTFQATLTASLGGLVSGGANGVVLTVPPMVLAPFFRAVPYNAVPLDEATATTLNGAFAGLNQVLDGLAAFQLLDAAEAASRKVSYSASANNPILMFDDALTDIGPLMDLLVLQSALSPAQRAALEPYRQARPATANDLPTLRAATEIGRVISPTAIVGVSIPIGDEFILSASEVVNVVTARATYNAIINGVVAGVNAQAGANLLTIVDVQPTFADLFGLNAATAQALALSQAAIDAADGALGMEVEGVTLAPDFSPNGVFSTDGLHPNPRGHGLVANLIIDHLNATYGASIPRISILPLRSVITTQ